MDTDGDGIGNNADLDDDNNGVDDTLMEVENDLGIYNNLDTTIYNFSSNEIEIKIEIKIDGAIDYRLGTAGKLTIVKINTEGGIIKVDRLQNVVIDLPFQKRSIIQVNNKGFVKLDLETGVLPMSLLPSGTEIEINKATIKYRVPVLGDIEFGDLE